MHDEALQMIQRVATDAGPKMSARRLARELTAEGLEVSHAAIARWACQGVRMPDGGHARLDHIRIGNKLVSTKAAVMRFLAGRMAPAAAPSLASA